MDGRLSIGGPPDRRRGIGTIGFVRAGHQEVRADLQRGRLVAKHSRPHRRDAGRAMVEADYCLSLPRIGLGQTHFLLCGQGPPGTGGRGGVAHQLCREFLRAFARSGRCPAVLATVYSGEAEWPIGGASRKPSGGCVISHESRWFARD